MKDNKILIFAFLLSIAVHTVILIGSNLSKSKVKQTPLAMSFQFTNPSFRASGLKKRAFKPVKMGKIEESKKINKSQPKKPKQIKKQKTVGSLQKKMSPTEKLVLKPKEKENIFKAGIAMATESPKSIDIPLEKPSMEKRAFEQNDITPVADILAAYLNQIRLMLEKEKRYPFLARKNCQEGTVYIKFTLLRDGGLKKIRVTKSSGFEILDKEAEATIRRISFPAFPKSLRLTQLQLEVPIVFRLVR